MATDEENKRLDRTSQYLLSEFNILNDRAKMFEKVKSSRVNFFLLIVAAIGAAISGLSQSTQFGAHIIELIILLSGVILMLGIFVLRDLSAYSTGVIYQYRWAGRIRRWFLEDNKDLKLFLPFRAVDDQPAFTSSFQYWRGSETIVLLINSFVIGLIVGLALYKYVKPNLLLSYSTASISAIIYWFVQRIFTRRMMQKVENSDYVKNSVNFPSSEYHF